MDKIPFSVYDFFGYLAPGVLFLGSVDYFILDHQLIEYAKENLITAIVSLIIVYIIGHFISSASYWSFEKIIVGKCLKQPSETLFKESVITEKKTWKKLLLSFIKNPKEFLFSSYYIPFSQTVLKKINDKLGRIDDSTDIAKGNAKFQLAFSKVKMHELSMVSLNNFLNLYGFARNISLVCIVMAFILIYCSIFCGIITNLWWIVGYLVAGVMMFDRFLKFYRYYDRDLFLSYLSLTEEEKGKS